MNDDFGVSGMKLHVPRLRVSLRDWCEWTGANWGKVESVVGRSFRMVAPNQSLYTMAADAVLRLIIDYEIDPARVGYLALGTESSTDNSAGAVVVKGMVDRALRSIGRSPLSRHCEVPEFKHACLGGIYAMKGAVRYLAHDARGRQAIVVCGDIAEYERGSTGEPTQGAGVVAMLLEERPALFSLDLRRAGSASAYRGPDFRKPFRRHSADGAERRTASKMHDFPVFSGRYSTVCYVDETLRAAEDMLAKLGVPPVSYYHRVSGLFLHRPYHQMPINAVAALYTWGLAHSEEHRAELQALCKTAGADFAEVLAETNRRPDLFDELVEGGRPGDEIYPECMKAVRALRATAKFRQTCDEKMSLGTAMMMDLGNLYTASLPAWIAAGLDDGLARGQELAEKEFVAFGYGSGDAAEAIPMRIAGGWREAAARIQFAGSMAHAIDLGQAQYESLHDHGTAPGIEDEARGFVIRRIGDRNETEFQDLGIEYYDYRP